jgi:hypothetical protein
VSWARLDDGFWMHPKVLMVGNTAAGVFARCLSYCGSYLTDGLVPEPIATQIAGGDRKALQALVDHDLLTHLPSGGFHIRDYLEYNRSKEETEAARKQRAEAGRKGGLKHKPKPTLSAVSSNG